MTNFIELTHEEMMTVDGGDVAEGLMLMGTGACFALKGAAEVCFSNDRKTQFTGGCEMAGGIITFWYGSYKMFN